MLTATVKANGFTLQTAILEEYNPHFHVFGGPGYFEFINITTDQQGDWQGLVYNTTPGGIGYGVFLQFEKDDPMSGSPYGTYTHVYGPDQVLTLTIS